MRCCARRDSPRPIEGWSLTAAGAKRRAPLRLPLRRGVAQLGSAPDWGSGGRGFKSPLPDQCPVSGHRGHLLQDIVHRPASTEWLVTASWVEGEGAEQLAIVGDDAYVGPATKSWTLLFLWSQVGRALALQDDCVDDVASERRHPPPPNMVVSTMSCDICPLCGELTHPLPDQSVLI